jgi:hypothetical protein
MLLLVLAWIIYVRNSCSDAPCPGRPRRTRLRCLHAGSHGGAIQVDPSAIGCEGRRPAKHDVLLSTDRSRMALRDRVSLCLA